MLSDKTLLYYQEKNKTQPKKRLKMIKLDKVKMAKNKNITENVLDNLPNGLSVYEMIFDGKGKPSDGLFLDINPAFERLVSIEREKIIGKTVKQVLPWLKHYLITTYRNTAKSGKHVYDKKFFKEIDKIFEINAYSPKIDHLVMIFTDITEHKKAEEEKKHLQSQLIQSQKIEAIGLLTGGIAHDFNNLLTVILGYSDVAMLQIEKKDKLKENLDQIRLAAQRAAKLVHQLLIFTRKKHMEFKLQNLTIIIENLLKMLNRIIGEDISIHFELDQDIWDSKMDQSKIEQVIMNLAVNAKDGLSKGGKLIIKTKNVIIDKDYIKSYSYARPGQFVCLSVEDTGIGMTEEIKQKIFEPFFTTKKIEEGTGLGLSVVYSIIKEHQGWITVSSELGKGSIFKIYFPACFEESVSELKAPVASQILHGKGEKVLFVEDDKTIREFMETRLIEKGYNVFTAEDGKNALNIFKRENYNIDLLFIDVVLPDKCGIEIVDKLISYNKKLKILVTSGYLDNKSKWTSIKERNLHFIQKPYTLNDLLHAIRESINQIA